MDVIQPLLNTVNFFHVAVDLILCSDQLQAFILKLCVDPGSNCLLLFIDPADCLLQNAVSLLLRLIYDILRILIGIGQYL